MQHHLVLDVSLKGGVYEAWATGETREILQGELKLAMGNCGTQKVNDAMPIASALAQTHIAPDE
jgi:hypothetical protein